MRGAGIGAVLAAQRAYAAASRERSKFGLMVPEAFVRGIRDLGYRSNGDAIADSIGELLEQKPYLGKAEQAPSGANITPPSGTRDGDRHQGQLTRDDLKTMSPAEIVKAQQDGRLKDLLGAN